MSHWGAMVFDVRRRSGLSRHDFGMRIGEPDYLVQRWELRGTEPLVHTALHVALRLGLRVDDLTGPAPPSWSGRFTSAPRVGKADTRWRENIVALAERAGSRAALARELKMSKIMVQSWVHRRSVPVLRIAVEVSDALGLDLHDLLTGTP